MGELEQKIVYSTSTLANAVNGIEVTFGHLRKEMGIQHQEREVIARKQKLLSSLAIICRFTQGNARTIIAARQAGNLQEQEWAAVIELCKGEEARLIALMRKIEEYVSNPSQKHVAEIQTLLSELKKLFAEELIQLRKMTGEERKAA